MKRRLNVLCLIIGLVLSYSILESAYYMTMSFVDGVRIGMDRNNPAVREKAINMKVVSLMPDNYVEFTDSVYNATSGMYVPVKYSQLIVSVKTPINFWSKVIVMLSSFTYIFSIIGAIFIFIRLIISINKSHIFIWKNVRRLRWLGAALIISFVCTAAPQIYAVWELSQVFSLAGYSFYVSEMIPIMTLVLAIVSLIVGEVFAIGLRLQEEQDLTI